MPSTTSGSRTTSRSIEPGLGEVIRSLWLTAYRSIEEPADNGVLLSPNVPPQEMLRKANVAGLQTLIPEKIDPSVAG